MELFLVGWIICIIAAIIIGNAKGRPPADSFMFGAVLGLIGVILVAVLPAPAPHGMRKVKCPRCDANQNIPEDDEQYACWQCHQTVTI